jgi:titin
MISLERLEGRTMMAADAGIAHLPASDSSSVAAHVFTPPRGTGDGPTTPVKLPGAPTGVTGRAADGRAILSWTAPADMGGAKRLGYMVQFSSDSGKTWNTVAPRFNETHAVVPLLTNGTPYVFRVAAFNKAGQGAFSDASAPVTPTAVTLPSAPTGLKAVAGNGRVLLTWTPPANTGGAERLGYVVEASTDGGKTWTTITRRGDEPRAVIPFLTNGTAYTFRVAAVNKAGQGAFSDPSATVTPSASTSLPPGRR